jgi:NADPH:quinone reductase-like Zn-dependent oxidoreductase
MKSVVYYKYGSPDVLRLENVEPPMPSANEVLLKVHAVSLNAWDWDMLTGKPLEYRLLSGLFKPKNKMIHGCDIAGRVEAVGKDIKYFKVGDEVFGDLAERGWGAFAEYACAYENDLVRKPSSMSFEEAACMSHGGNLAVQGIIDFGKIKAGQKVLINGGGGSTGTLAIQLAKLFDVEVTGVDRAEKLEMMRALGADHVIDYTKVDFTNQGRQYDLIFDVKTTRSIFNYKRALNPNGNYVTVGGKTSRILQLVLFRKLCGKVKMHMVGYKANKDSQYLITLFEAGKIRPVIDKCFALEKTADAFRYFGEGRFKGKIVVTVANTNGFQPVAGGAHNNHLSATPHAGKYIPG